jgi:hypothetical protein
VRRVLPSISLKDCVSRSATRGLKKVWQLTIADSK